MAWDEYPDGKSFLPVGAESGIEREALNMAKELKKISVPQFEKLRESLKSQFGNISHIDFHLTFQDKAEGFQGMVFSGVEIKVDNPAEKTVKIEIAFAIYN